MVRASVRVLCFVRVDVRACSVRARVLQLRARARLRVRTRARARARIIERSMAQLYAEA